MLINGEENSILGTAGTEKQFFLVRSEVNQYKQGTVIITQFPIYQI